MTVKKVQYNDNGGVYKPSDILSVLSMSVNNKNLTGNSKGVYYYNVPCSFDIETTSFYRDEAGCQYSYEQLQKLQGQTGKKIKLEKVATMYVWQWGINGNVIVGRTWREFVDMMQTVVETLGLNEKRRLICYVHNLAYEFQFIRERFTWNKVFSIDLRKPIYAITNTFIEFRCSYLLSGYGLGKLGSQLLKYKVEKKTGDLDYQLIRHSGTVLTDTEMGYCVNDVKVVMSYIQEKIEEVKGITNLPLTKTGFVRKYCRGNCLYLHDENGKRQQNYRYMDLMSELQISGLGEFNALQRAFAGGFTHANGYHTDHVMTNVSSYDFTSSYPYVMVAEQFPMSRGVKVNVKSQQQFEVYLSKYCCVFDIQFTDITCMLPQDNPISVSKCFQKDGVVENNGRVMCAKSIALTITNVDYEVYKKFYKWKSAKIGDMYCYRRGYLPTEFVKSILGLYEKKTTLKGVKGMEVEYLNSKEMLNSCYGMSVTNPLRDEFTYTGEWDITQFDNEQLAELLFKYNTTKNRFLFYPWGIFVTAYARRNLFTAIIECGNDYIYSDTDSVTILNADSHKDYFNKYNNEVVEKLQRACKHHGISFDLCKPKTIKGVEKLLGVWDYEGTYERFKTLGAKRYMVQEKSALTVDGVDYDYSLTVSGVNKKCAIPYLVEKYGDAGIFEAFSNYLYLPPIACGKNIHTYIDFPQSGEVVDYNGEVGYFEELTTVHLEPTDYNLNLSVLYLNYLRGLKLKEE